MKTAEIFSAVFKIREVNFFLFERKKLQKRSKKPAVLSLIDSESSLSRSPIGYHPPQRTRS
jgi:hypothetical protein